MNYYTFYPPITRQIKIVTNQFEVKIKELILFEKVVVEVILRGTDNAYSGFRIYTLEGEDYTNWADDDKYIINYVKRKLSNESNNQSNNQFISESEFSNNDT